MKKGKILIIALIVVTVLISSFTFYVYQMLYSANFQIDKEDTYIHIKTGSSFDDVRNMMFDKGVLNDPVSFSFLSKLMEYDQLVKPGRYLIRKNANNLSTIRMLRAGEQQPVRITFTNVRLMEELAEKLASYIELEADTLLRILSDPATSEKYGFNTESFRCMFIPNTYEVYWTISANQLLDRLNGEYKRFWNDQRLEKAEKLDMSPVEVSILASIVEAESRHADESPVIAGLYLNRLKDTMPLQADPTLVYAVGDFTIQRVLKVHKEIESPYNTYKYAGLPPGPVVFPSIISIDAVLNYKKSNYLYMCAKEDFSGYHNFTSSYREHQNNARRYQAELDKRKLYQ